MTKKKHGKVKSADAVVGRPWSDANATHRWHCVCTQSVGDARLHAVRENVRDPVLVLGLCQNHNANVPQSVDRHLEVNEVGLFRYSNIDESLFDLFTPQNLKMSVFFIGCHITCLNKSICASL